MWKWVTPTIGSAVSSDFSFFHRNLMIFQTPARLGSSQLRFTTQLVFVSRCFRHVLGVNLCRYPLSTHTTHSGSCLL